MIVGWALPYIVFNIQKRNQLYQNVFQFNFILFSERFIDDENVVDSRLLPKIYKELMSASHATFHNRKGNLSISAAALVVDLVILKESVTGLKIVT